MKNFEKILLLILIFCNISYTQRVLTLDEALSIALGKSFRIESAEYSLESSQKSLEAAQRGLLSTVDLEFDLPRYSQSLSSQFNSQTGTEQFYKVGFTTFEGRILFNQPIIFSNGTFSLIGSLWKRDQFTAQINPVDYYSNLSLRLRQPLFTFNNQKANLKRAEINLEKSKKNYTRAEKEIVYDVTSSFYRLFQAKKNVEIANEKVKQTEISYNTAGNKFKAGLIAEVEALQLEVDLAASNNDLLNAQQNFNEIKDNFKLLIGLDLKENIDVAANLDYNPIEVDENLAVQYALKNSTELSNLDADIELSNLNVNEVDSRGNISALLTANYGINKVDTRFRDVFHDFLEDRSVTFTLSVPVFDWGKNIREVEAAEAQQSLIKLTFGNQENVIEKDIIALVNKIKSAKARVEVLSKSVDLAQKSYDISLSRFEAGTITSFDLSQMQLRLTDSKISSLNALIDYKISLGDLARRTFHDFEKE
ncbi:MAG: TolC family protein [Ignavibacteriaceae bacterium]